MLAIAVTLVPLPLLAADTAAAAKAQPLKTSIATHAKREALAPTPKQSGTPAARPQTASSNPHSAGFFRSPAGVACLAVIAAGTGFAIYSASHDRIHSVARQGQ